MSKEKLLQLFKEYKIIVYLAVLCLGLFLFSKIVTSFGKPKIDTSKEYVYTKETSSFKDTKEETTLPFVNLQGEDAKDLNQRLEKIYQDQENTILNYQYDVSGDNLSILYYTTKLIGSTPVFEMHTEVFSISSKRKLENSEILKQFGISLEEAKEKVSQKMNQYYQKMIQEGEVEPSECNFSCFLEWKKWDPSSLQLYIHENTLSHIQSWTVYSPIEEDWMDSYVAFEITK